MSAFKAYVVIKEGDCYSGIPNKNLFVAEIQEQAAAKIQELEGIERIREEAHTKLRAYHDLDPRQSVKAIDKKQAELAVEYGTEVPEWSPLPYSKAEYWIDEVEVLS